jgi:hypothetical protein
VIDGTWSWSYGDDRIDAPTSYSAEVTFTPDVLTPMPPVAGNPGHLPSTVDVTIAVLKAVPVSFDGVGTDVIYGQTLSTSSITHASVTGVFGETVVGDVTWMTPDVIPSDALGEVGIYTAEVTFVPTGSFAAVYEVTTFTLDVRIIPDTSALDEISENTAAPLSLIIHSENYTTEALLELEAALDHANTVREDTTYTYTQSDVDAADARLTQALGALSHDHPVLVQTPEGTVTARGQEVRVIFKGYLPDVTSLVFANTTYTLLPQGVGANLSFDILDGTTRIGTLTQGSAAITLNSAFINTLANGSYTLKLGFADSYTLLGNTTFTQSGEGTAEVVINRTPDTPATVPKTADTSLPHLLSALALLASGILTVCVAVFWRKRRLVR